jgi:hypothetical protein
MRKEAEDIKLKYKATTQRNCGRFMTRITIISEQTWSPAKYMNDLSHKRSPNMRNFVEMGMSKKKGTKDANMRPYGPDVNGLKDGSAFP